MLSIPDPTDPDRDRFIMSKGHAVLALYGARHPRGWISAEDLENYAGDGTLLGMHPEHRVPGIDFSTGSPGHGPSMGVGAAGAWQAPHMARSRDGIEIAYETHGRTGGDALAVVLVHGWAGNRTYWADQVDLLSERNHVVAVVLGGHGESGVGREDWNLPAFADNVVAAVEELDAGDVADGDEPTSTAEDVAAFVAPFREDFGVAVDRFARSLFPEGADGALIDRVAGDMAAAPRDAALGSLGYPCNRHPPIVAINPDAAPTDYESLRRRRVEQIDLR